MITDDVFQTVEQSGGESLLIPPGASAECTERIIAEDTPGRECPHDDFEIRRRTGTIGISEDGVPIRNIESPYGGGVRSLPGAAGNCLPVMFTEQIIAEDIPVRECPHDDFEIRPRTGTGGISEDGVPIRNIESPYGGGVRSLPGAAGNCLPVMFTERIIAEDIPGRECPHDDFEIQPRTGTVGISEDGVPIRNIESSPVLAGTVFR